MSSTVTLTALSSQIQQEVQEDFAKIYLDNASKERAAEVMHKAMNDPEVKRQAQKDVKELAETLRSIRRGFLKVAEDLTGFDSAGFRDKNNARIQLGDLWETYRSQFDDVVQYSLEQATGSSTFIRTFTSILNMVQSKDTRDLRLEVAHFLEVLATKEHIAKEVKDKFTAIADNVHLFSARIDEALEKAEQPIKIDLDKARERLNDLHKKLEEIEEKIKSLSTTLVQQTSAGRVAACVSILLISPIAIIVAAKAFHDIKSTTLSITQANEDKARTKDEIDEANLEIKNLHERLELVNKYRESFEDTKVLTRDISTKLRTIASIWQTINLDMHALHTDLTTNFAGDPPLTKFFLAKLKNTEKIYTHLALLLDTYVKQMIALDKD